MNVLVLNSAQSKHPRGDDSWVQATVRAVDGISRLPDVRFLVDIDPLPWSLVAYLATLTDTRLSLALRACEGVAGRELFGLTLNNLGFSEDYTSPLFTGWNGSPTVKASWQQRDRVLTGHADIIVPVSIRSGGRLDSLLCETAGKRIMDDYRVPYAPGGRKRNLPVNERRVRPLPPGEWLIHWTRASAGPWPGETLCGFWSHVLDEPDRYVRSAVDTLERILRERIIRGSGRHLPGKRTAVGFTSLALAEAVKLMRWRKRYAEYSFEPYGIALRADAAVAAGCRQVSYSDGATGADPLFVHAPGPEDVWRGESEWRIEGDCNLARFGSDDILAIVPDNNEADHISSSLPVSICIHTLY